MNFEQLVGLLWITGGLLLNIPHRESRPLCDAMNHRSRYSILTKIACKTGKSKRAQTFKLFCDPSKKIFALLQMPL
jgi:hypothetical protein